MEKTAFKDRLVETAGHVDRILRRVLQSVKVDGRLREAMVYTLVAPGKRIRSALVLWCCELVSGSINSNAEIAAAAVEMVHTYSLVHDDLPAMDDDDLRRGRATCHKAFDDATAILAGDAILTLAFEILAEQIDDAVVAVRLISQLARDAGASGMIAGQMADLRAQNGGQGQELLEYIHTNKTAKMFRCAAVMGAICAGAGKGELSALCEYGLKIGLGFQIADDILDICGTSEHLGKTAGKDAKVAKCTYPAIHGLEESKKFAEQLAREAVKSLEGFGPESDVLRDLAFMLLERSR